MAAVDGANCSNSVDRAMNQVLEAERAARDAVERCRAEAAQILSDAEEGARRIADRTERRIELVHRIADRAAECALEETRGSEPLSGCAVPEADLQALLDRVVDDLVQEILGGRP